MAKMLVNLYRIRFVSLLAVLMPLMALAQQATTRADESITIFTDVMRQVDVNYVDTLNYEDLTETAINAMLRKIDPYTVYYPKKNDRDLRLMTTGKYGGIGSIIQQRPIKRGKSKAEIRESKDSLATYIINPYEGKPAQRAGIQAGDRLLSVDGKTTKGLSVSEVSNNLRGEPGTTVVLEIERDGEKKPFKVSVVREDIHLEPVTYYSAIDSIGYIAFGEFTEGSALAFTNALDELYYNQGIRRLVIDLRDNGGGLVDEALQLVNLFVDRDQMIVETKGKTSRIRTLLRPARSLPERYKT